VTEKDIANLIAERGREAFERGQHEVLSRAGQGEGVAVEW